MNYPLLGALRLEMRPISTYLLLVSFVSICMVQKCRFPVSIKHGLWTAECRRQTGYKTQTEV